MRQVGQVPENDWNYYSFQIGQHIGFHSKKSLKKAFEIAGYESKKLISYGNSLHAFVNTKEWRLSIKISHPNLEIISIIEIFKKIFNRIILKKKFNVG